MAYSHMIFANDLGRIVRRSILALGVLAWFSLPALAQTATAASDLLTSFELAHDRSQVDLTFRAADDSEVRLSSYRGKVVILNFWATWCAPCVKEMPSLDRAQALLGPGFKVLALSLDAASSRPKVPPFYRERKLENLEIHFDIGRQAFQVMNVLVLPTTVLIDTDGREVGRLQGEADWDTPQALKLIRSLAAATQ